MVNPFYTFFIEASQHLLNHWIAGSRQVLALLGAGGKPRSTPAVIEPGGTLCLIANLEVATGRIVASSMGPHRTEADFLAHIKQTVAQAPQDPWLFIVDNLNTHQSASLVEWIAHHCGIEADLGLKDSHGILKSMASRDAFLADPSHRVRFVYTPKHASWLNRIEIWFSILVGRLLKRASFNSIEELHQALINFIEYFNATMASRLSGPMQASL